MSPLTQPGADIWICDKLSVDDALSRTTHLGIGAQQDDLAVQGRRRANATFFDSHGSDLYSSVAWGVDLKPLVEDASLSMEAFIADKVTQLSEDIVNRVSQFS